MDGKVIRKKRRLLGMTQIELGEKLGYSQSFISALESGERLLHESKEEKLKKILNKKH